MALRLRHLLLLAAALCAAADEEPACPTCLVDEDCLAVADGSKCINMQCTDENGLFGLRCLCDVPADCASHRCDGFLQTTCRNKKEAGEGCNESSDCISGRCTSFLVCGTASPIISQTVAPTDSSTFLFDDGWNPLACHRCQRDDECGGSMCRKGVCTDFNGKVPENCMCGSTEDCADDMFCLRPVMQPRNSQSKRCVAKRDNGARCGRNDACKSGHCNILFRCESTGTDDVKEPLSPPWKTTATYEGDITPEEDEGNPGRTAAIWCSMLGAIAVFLITVIFISVKRKQRNSSMENDEVKPSEENPKEDPHV